MCPIVDAGGPCLLYTSMVDNQVALNNISSVGPASSEKGRLQKFGSTPMQTDVDHADPSCQPSQNCLHQSLKFCWCITESERRVLARPLADGFAPFAAPFGCGRFK